MLPILGLALAWALDVFEDEKKSDKSEKSKAEKAEKDAEKPAPAKGEKPAKEK